MHYVGLSRVRNSSAMHIFNLNENKLKVSEKVKSEMSRLRTQVSLVPLAVLRTDNSLRSLHLHIDDVRSDSTFKKLMSTFLLKQNFAC